MSAALPLLPAAEEDGDGSSEASSLLFFDLDFLESLIFGRLNLGFGILYGYGQGYWEGGCLTTTGDRCFRPPTTGALRALRLALLEAPWLPFV